MLLKELKSIEIEKAIVYLMENDLAKIVIKDNVILDEKDIEYINETKQKLLNERSHVVLFIPPVHGSITKEGREMAASVNVLRNAVAKAIIAGNLASRIVGNFFIKFHKPDVPILLFNSEEKAVKWLFEMKQKHQANQSLQ